MGNKLDKKVAIHQPNYLPWLGFFNKMAVADVFVILDTAQFTKNSYQNRVKIKTSKGPQWLSQPVRLADGAFKPTNQVVFADKNWGKKHIKTLQANYGRAAHFKEYFLQLADIIQESEEKLSVFNLKLIRWAAGLLGIETPIVLASDFASNLTQTARLIELVKWVGGATYLSGKGGKNYQDEMLFAQAEIKLEILTYNCLPYPQLWGKFTPGLSVVDLILNCGKEAKNILMSGQMPGVTA